jgi:glycosyltransferase involved in cell wall biosynthesis
MEEMASYTERISLVDASETLVWLKEKKGTLISIYAHRKKVSQYLRNVKRDMKSAFLQLVREKPYDIVLFHGKSVFSVIEDWNNLPIVIDFCDATSMRIREQLRFANGLKRLALVWKYRKMKKIEKKVLNKTPHLAFISCRDRDAVIDNCGSSVGIVPIGVDLNFWTRKTKRAQSNCIVFTGVMNYRPNEDAALHLINDILPLVRPVIPDLEVLIVGRDPSAELLERANQFSDVTVTGFVDDMRTYLERAALFVAPMRYASGIQNKVLEAMAMNIPVLCTAPVAEGLYFDDQKNPPVRVAEGTKVFAASIAALLGNQLELDRLANDGREFVQKRFVWSHNAQILERMLVTAVKTNTHADKQAMN